MSECRGTILVVEDDPPLRRMLRIALETQGYKTRETETGQGAVDGVATDPPDLVILDLGLPDLDGVEVTRRLRQWSAVPIVVVSARGKDFEKVVALDAGADDYVTKPFSVGELLARVRAALRRANAIDNASLEPVFSVGGLRVDLARREVQVDGQSIHLTRHEFDLLRLLVRNAGKVLTHAKMLRDVWGPEAVNETHYLRVYMNQLRQKLEPNPSQPVYLLTETGVGYRLVTD